MYLSVKDLNIILKKLEKNNLLFKGYLHDSSIGQIISLQPVDKTFLNDIEKKSILKEIIENHFADQNRSVKWISDDYLNFIVLCYYKQNHMLP